jgi:hypothetical protein
VPATTRSSAARHGPTRYRRRTPETTVLHRVVREHLATFLASADARAEADPGRVSLPHYVRRELDNFVDCGILARGFVRASCDSRRQSILVADSCHARAVCPSCTSRRMAEVAAHLTDHVLPSEAPIRQWVLSLPHRVRYLLARDPELCREVRGIFVRAVQSFYVHRARDQGLAGGRCGAVVHTQRSDSALRLNVHFHTLWPDGVFTCSGKQTTGSA